MKLFKYFSGKVELGNFFPMKRETVRAKFPQGTIKRFDSFDLLVGTIDGRTDRENFQPVTRIICFNPNGTAHKCGAHCRCAKGGDCECSCGGQFHGIDRAF